tara:strand:+ start:13065 stop:13433 length:369 start_codon:yes stop_codon:yes gene_type:complete
VQIVLNKYVEWRVVRGYSKWKSIERAIYMQYIKLAKGKFTIVGHRIKRDGALLPPHQVDVLYDDRQMFSFGKVLGGYTSLSSTCLPNWMTAEEQASLLIISGTVYKALLNNSSLHLEGFKRI